ncbi:MAG: hypothetical protein Q8M40_03410 [Legionella sp.]|nr:hypothetical protein [Legionella sp.]
MNSIQCLKRFSTEELYCLLNSCAEFLTLAFQESKDCDFWYLAMEAKLACEALGFEIHSLKKNTLIH